MKYLAPIILILTTLIGLPSVSQAFGTTTSPLVYHNITAPTCAITSPNVQPPQCVDYGKVFERPRLCNSTNPSVVPPACSKPDEPFNALTPGQSLSGPQLSDICNDRYLANVPATSTVLNEVAQQAYVNNHVPFKKIVDPCTGSGCILDNLIPLNLGGSNTLSNLWPQPTAGTWTAAQKDALETTLRTRVCTLDIFGFQKVSFTAVSAGTDATNLVGGTTYTATITVAGTPKAISILGSDAQTFSTLVTELNKDLSFTAGYQGINVGGNKQGTDLTNLVGITTYTATIVVDGVTKPISILGSAAQTYTTLLSEINTDLGASATATIVGGNLRVTSATSGSASSVVITAGTLFAYPDLTGFVALFAPVNGTDIAVASLIPSQSGFQNVLFSAPKVLATATGLNNDATVYTATITVDGVAKAISIVGSAAQTYTTLLSEINTDLAASAVASLNTLGNLQVISATNGTASTVSIVDAGTNHLFAKLTSYSSIGPAFAGPVGYIKIAATIFAVPSTVSIANSGANHLFAAPLTNFGSILPAVLGHPTKVDIDVARGELTGNWKAAYVKYIQNNQ